MRARRGARRAKPSALRPRPMALHRRARAHTELRCRCYRHRSPLRPDSGRSAQPQNLPWSRRRRRGTPTRQHGSPASIQPPGPWAGSRLRPHLFLARYTIGYSFREMRNLDPAARPQSSLFFQPPAGLLLCGRGVLLPAHPTQAPLHQSRLTDRLTVSLIYFSISVIDGWMCSGVIRQRRSCAIGLPTSHVVGGWADGGLLPSWYLDPPAAED